MASNNWFCQFLSDVLDVSVDRPSNTETTALGAAYLAGIQTGLFASLESIAGNWEFERRFNSEMKHSNREDLLGQWRKAVKLAVEFAGSQ